MDQVKAIVRQFWARRAPEFDSEADHILHSEGQRRAWLALLGSFCERVPARVLDVGCGTGFLARLYADLGHRVTGIDLSPEMIEIARQKGASVEFRVGDAESTLEAADSYDLVVARHLLWTLPEPGRAVAEWLRVLRPGGRIALVEGHWGVGELSGEYGEIHTHLPFLGGEVGEKVAAFLRECGVREVGVLPLMDPVLWHEVPKYPRYVVVGRK